MTIPTGYAWDGDGYLKRDVSTAAVAAIADQTYTGSAITPATEATWKGDTMSEAVAMTVDTDYTVAYTDNTNVGTATVTLTGKGDYTGTTNVTFKIVPKALTITVAGTTDTSLVYNGSEQTVAVDSSKYTLSCSDGLYDASKVARTATEAKGTAVKADYALGLAASQFSYGDANIAATFEVTDGKFAITAKPVNVTVTRYGILLVCPTTRIPRV